MFLSLETVAEKLLNFRIQFCIRVYTSSTRSRDRDENETRNIATVGDPSSSPMLNSNEDPTATVLGWQVQFIIITISWIFL
jgi:hypothetical protein